MNNSYLITGGAGFIGNCFVKLLLKKHPDARAVVLDALTYAGNLASLQSVLNPENCFFVKGNICDRALVKNLFDTYDFDKVVNFAAETHVDRSIENPDIFLETNVKGTQVLLDAAKAHWTVGKDKEGYPVYKAGVRYLQISTDEVYGQLGPTGYFTEDTPLNPRSPYSAAKTSADLFVNAYFHTYKLPVNITRCSNNYGPWQFPEKLIPLTITHILQAKPLPVYGKGEQIRDWIYVEDHCAAIDRVLHHAAPGESYNIGGHNEKQNIEVVKQVIKIVRELLERYPSYRKALKYRPTDEKGNLRLDWINDSLICFVRDRLGHDKRYAIDPSKIQREVGWSAQTPFEQGMEKTVAWYLENI